MDGHFLGFFGFSHHRWYPDQVEIGWRLDRAYWGGDWQRKGAAAALRHGFIEPGFSLVISVIHRDNASSRGVTEKIGLQLWREAELLPIVIDAIERPAVMMVSKDAYQQERDDPEELDRGHSSGSAPPGQPLVFGECHP